MVLQGNANEDLLRYRQMDDDALQSYARQLVAEHRHQDLYAALLENEAWMQAKYERFGNDESCIADLHLAIESASDDSGPVSILIVAQLWATYQLAKYRGNQEKNEKFEHLHNLDAAIQLIQIAVQLGWKKETDFLLDKMMETEMPTEKSRHLGTIIHHSEWENRVQDFFEKSFEATKKIEHRKTQSEERYRLVQELIATGEIARAYEITLTVQNAYFSGDCYKTLGRAYIDAGRWDDVENLLSHKMLVYSRIALLLRLSTALGKRGQFRQSNVYAEEAIHLAKRIQTDIEWLWRSSTAVELARAGYIDIAQEIAEKIEDSTWKSTAFSGIAKSLIDETRFELTETILDRIERGHQKDEALKYLAIALADKSQYQAGYDTAQRISFKVSRLYTLQKIREIAINLEAIDFIPEITEAINNLDIGEAAISQFKLGNIEQAEALLYAFMEKPALKFKSDLLTWGLNLCRLGEKMLKVNWIDHLDRLIDAASAIVPQIDYSYSRVHLSGEIGDLLVKLGRFGDAFAVLDAEYPAHYLKRLLDWIPAIEKTYAGLGKKAVIEITRVFGWLSPFWQEVHVGLSRI
ncbi:MAG: hypothetical protein BroJett018_45040 [Chloroflexota bacterium]|nr:hypothetical protein [Chloroflexota bacterium]NOG65322.1 hypothetical protein [Chloroflexota bacterium]GIK66710.1 MAG: hypothetical protein BroJett018_45040 [Chloroflexota bacterium]